MSQLTGTVVSIDPKTQFAGVIYIKVKSNKGTDEYYISKVALKKQKLAILQRTQSQAGRAYYLDNSTIEKLAKHALNTEINSKKAVSITFEKALKKSTIVFIETKPLLKHKLKPQALFEVHTLKKPGKIITQGIGIGNKIAQGKVRVITDQRQLTSLKKHEILVTSMIEPHSQAIIKRAAAIVMEQGGRTCHAAITARELGIPMIIGCCDASKILKTGTNVTVTCEHNRTGYVYSGLVPYEIKHLELAKFKSMPYPLRINLGDPHKAFAYQAIPNEGVGLARLEFIIGNTIGIHPQALLNYAKLPKRVQTKIAKRTAAYVSPSEFYIEKLREGIATIAAAFHPKPVIFRFSDFISNEYRNLLGGELYEPTENNPMLGFRGASRYLNPAFQPAFALECEAFKRVRNDMGFTNVKLMVPFVRTLAQAQAVIKLLTSYGLKYTKRSDLQIYMNCEVPSNAILAEEFLQYFAGFSIGTNDLTQMTLGLDRDSSLIADLFDEQNAAIKLLLQKIIKACKQQHKFVSICGQAPSDHIEFAKWLIAQGIDNISLSPDAIIDWLFH